MIPNKKGLQVVMKGTFTPGWENRIFTLTGEKQTNGWGECLLSSNGECSTCQ